MDPDKTLDNIRAIVTELDKALPGGHVMELADELSWMIKDLDQWLTNGGFPPTAWKHTH